jgi:RNA polymerase sigma-70 factor (ECF subfamily)
MAPTASKSASSDQARFERALRGDTEAFWSLVERHSRMLHAVAHGVVHDVEKAQDVVHDTYVRAFSTLGNLRSPEKLGSWLSSMARNVAHEQVRKGEKLGKVIDQIPVADVVPVSETLIREEELGELEAAMAGLPESHRVVLGLKYMSHLSCGEIAGTLGISVEAAKSRLFEARKLLRRRVEAARKAATPPLPAPAPQRGVHTAPRLQPEQHPVMRDEGSVQ